MAKKKFSTTQELVVKHLSRAENAKKQADRNIDELCELKSIREGLEVAFSDVKNLPKENARYVEVCEKIDNFKEKVLCDNERYVELRKDITKQIDSLSDLRYSLILKKRYLDFKTIEEIADEMNYSSRHIIYLHKEALDAFFLLNQNQFIESH